jgi:hypothetical protein
MRNGFVTLLIGVSSLMFAVATQAAGNSGSTRSSDSPYGSITLRNVFDLRPMPPPPTNVPPPEAPPNVDLIGVTTLLGYPQGVFAVHEKGKPTTDSFIMKDGERQGALEVISISMASKSARVKIDDKLTELTLVEPKAGPAGGMAVAGAAGAMAPGMAGNIGRPGFVPQPQPYLGSPQGGGGGVPNTYPVPPVNPGASPYGGVNPASANLNFSGAGAQSYANPLGVSSGTPTRPVRTEVNITPQQQALMMEAQRAEAIKNGSPIANLIPPTMLTPLIQQDAQGQNQAPTGPPVPQRPLGSYGTGTLK